MALHAVRCFKLECSAKRTCSCFLPFVGHCSWSRAKVSSIGPGQTSMPGVRSFIDLNAGSLDIFSLTFNLVYCASASWSFSIVKLSELNFRVWRKSSRVYSLVSFFDISVCFNHNYSPFLFRMSMIHWSLIRLKRLFSHNSRKCCRSLKFKSLWESEIGGAAIFSEDTVHGSSWYQSAILVLFIPVIL